MSLWGIADSKTASGTVVISSLGAVTGTGTSFTTQAKVGNYIRVAGEDYFITNIASNTAATVVAANNGATLTAVASTVAYTLSEKPKYVGESESINTSGTQGDTTKVYGVDTTEATISKKIAHSGWVRRVAGSGGRSGRVQTEVLVANSSITGDQADDTQFPDA
jgi:hypothetical protein